jgi:hypothetical protein
VFEDKIGTKILQLLDAGEESLHFLLAIAEVVNKKEGDLFNGVEVGLDSLNSWYRGAIYLKLLGGGLAAFRGSFGRRLGRHLR